MLLSYDDKGSGPVVILLHGFPFDRTMWAAQTGEVGATYRLITPDLRGHGRSVAPPDRVYSMDAMADDVMETIDFLNLREPVVLGGLSMGGYVALSAVLRYPARFRALILLDTRATADTPEVARNRESTADQVDATGDIEPVVAAMIPRLFSPLTREIRPEVVEPIRSVMASTLPRTIAAALRGMAARPDHSADLPRITIPTLVLVGSDDVVTPPAESRAMAAALPASSLVVLPDAGHLAPLENQAATNRALLSFLSQLA